VGANIILQVDFCEVELDLKLTF